MKSEPSPTERMNPSSTRISGMRLLLGRFGEPRRRARGPNGDAASRSAAGCRKRRILGAPKDRRAGARPQKMPDLPTLPERHSEANRDIPVDCLDFLPLSEDLQNVLERGGFPAVRIEIAGREEASARKYFVDRPAKRFLRYAGLVRRDAPARIERIGKAADFGSGQQREKAGLAAGRVDRSGSADRFPNVHRSGQDRAPARGGVSEKAGRQTATGRSGPEQQARFAARRFRPWPPRAWR